MLVKHFCRKFQQNIDNDKSEIVGSVIRYFTLNLLSVTGPKTILDGIYIRPTRIPGVALLSQYVNNAEPNE